MQALVLLTALAGSLSPGSLVGSVAPLPELSFVLQTAAVGTAVGSAIALRAKRRNPDVDSWSITTAWATLGFLLGAFATLVPCAL
jgi:hypothetical protein